MEAFNDFVGMVNGLVWGWPMIILLLGTGVFLSVGLRFYTLLNIPYAFRLLGEKPEGKGDITPFQALTTALSATIGNGNIVGVAAAIVIGGPGAVFWMWIVALVGMATKYGEAVLAVKYRETDSRGRMQGGPMYYIKNGMGPKWAWLGWLFAFFAMIAAFGIGNMFQANAVAEAIAGPVLGHVAETASHDNAKLIVGFILSGLTLAVILGGVKRIGTVAQYLMPFMAAIYVIAGIAVILMNVQQVPAAFGMIFNYAFTGTAAGGGIAGGLIIIAMRFGFARGIFSNEAGLGSAAIAHAAAKTDDPVRQGTVAMLGTFIDTLIVCTITALAILTVSFSEPREFTEVQHIEMAEDGTLGAATWSCASGDELEAISSGALLDGEQVVSRRSSTTVPWQSCTGSAVLTATVFDEAIPFGALIVTLGTVLFAYSTLLGWSYYGERTAEYIFGVRVIMPYRLLWAAVIVLATSKAFEFQDILNFADTMNGLMAVPNLIALLALSGVIFAATKEAQAKRK